MADSGMMDLGDLRPDFERLFNECMNSGKIDQNLYVEYDVKRGLRDSNGKGVLTGLTEISDVVAFRKENGREVPIPGELYFQGYNVVDLLNGNENRRYAFEEITYLLLFGSLPDQKQLEDFIKVMTVFQELPNRFVRDVIMKASSNNIMNALQKSIVNLYSYDPAAEDISAENVLLQSMNIIAKMPLISVYAYWSYLHFVEDQMLFIQNPRPEYSTAENLLYILRPTGEFTPLEARVLDACLVLHADHGGGNNSTFTTHVVTSSGTDTYSAFTAAIASLKGYRHGGANLKVTKMFEDLEANVSNWRDPVEIENYLKRILDKEVFDKKGLLYGVGHAVYTESDPRAVVLKKYARELAIEKGRLEEFEFYTRVEDIAKRLVTEERKLFKPICVNVDFYSGFVYDMLGIPQELFTPIFAISRISGWSAHRLEEIINDGKIIRPAYKYVGHHRDYVPFDER